MNNVVVTELETKVIRQICNMVASYAGAVETVGIWPVWSNSLSLYGEVSGRQLSGATASLVKKGLVRRIDDEDGACLEFTEEGLKLALELEKKS